MTRISRAWRAAAVLLAVVLAVLGISVLDRDPPAEAAGPRFEAVFVTPASGPAGRGFVSAWLRRETPVRDRREGKVVARLKERTQWGSPRVLSVVKRRRGWLGVSVHQRPNGELGWIRRRSARLLRGTEKLVADLSKRRLTVYRNGRVRKRIRIGIGKRANSTPTGRFAITDTLRVRGSSPYGCCVLALSGRQPELPAGWTGGNRLAIHGGPPGTDGSTPTIGCLRASLRDMRWLLRQRFQPGTPVFIRK